MLSLCSIAAVLGWQYIVSDMSSKASSLFFAHCILSHLLACLPFLVACQASRVGDINNVGLE